MRVFAIGDLHMALSLGDKPMDIFGPQWVDHWPHMRADWLARVTQEDLVLLPGDISWALQAADAAVDLRAIGELPGEKLLIKGNHDYWWGSLARVRQLFPPEGKMKALQNDAFYFDAPRLADRPGLIVAGSRGWVCPNAHRFTADDRKLYLREAQRLELSLQAAARLRDAHPSATLLAMMHFPPIAADEAATAYTELLERYGAHLCIYGHLHGESLKDAYEGLCRGVQYVQVSSDGLDFQLKELI